MADVKFIVGTDGSETIVPLTQAEIDRKALFAQDAAAFQAAKDAETARIASYDGDVSVANRAAFLTKLSSMNATDLETFVRGYVNSSAVTDLPSQLAFDKRVENAIVVLTKMLVKDIRR